MKIYQPKTDEIIIVVIALIFLGAAIGKLLAIATFDLIHGQ